MDVYIYSSGRKLRADLGVFLHQARKEPPALPSTDEDEMSALVWRLSHTLQTIMKTKKLTMGVQLSPWQARALALVYALGVRMSEAGYAIGILENFAVFSLDVAEDSQGSLFQVANLDTGETVAVDADAISTLRTIGNLKLIGSSLFDDLDQVLLCGLEDVVRKPNREAHEQ